MTQRQDASPGLSLSSVPLLNCWPHCLLPFQFSLATCQHCSGHSGHRWDNKTVERKYTANTGQGWGCWEHPGKNGRERTWRHWLEVEVESSVRHRWDPSGRKGRDKGLFSPSKRFMKHPERDLNHTHQIIPGIREICRWLASGRM